MTHEHDESIQDEGRVRPQGLISSGMQLLMDYSAFLAVLVIGAGVASLIATPYIQQAWEAARRAECKSGLKQIGLALHNYHATHAVLPDAASPNADASPSDPQGAVQDPLAQPAQPSTP